MPLIIKKINKQLQVLVFMVQCIYTTLKCNEQNNYLIFQSHPA